MEVLSTPPKEKILDIRSTYCHDNSPLRPHCQFVLEDLTYANESLLNAQTVEEAIKQC